MAEKQPAPPSLASAEYKAQCGDCGCVTSFTARYCPDCGARFTDTKT